jgi:hypothetical protein
MGLGWYQLAWLGGEVIPGRWWLKFSLKFFGWCLGAWGVIVGGREFYQRYYCQTVKRWVIHLGLGIIFLEVVIFNFRFWESLLYRPVVLTPSEVGRTFIVDDQNNYVFISPDHAYLEFAPLDIKLANLYLDLATSNDSIPTASAIRIYLTDQARSDYYALPPQVVATAAPLTHYFRLHPSGKVGKIRIEWELHGERPKFQLRRIVANQPVPFHFSFWRFGVLLGVVGLYLVFRPQSRLWRLRLNYWQQRGQKLLLLGLWLLTLGLFGQVGRLYNSSGFTLAAPVTLSNDTQYQKLAEALSQGKFSLEAAPAALAQIANPYDPAQRRDANISYSTDTAYYQGQYYTYFGLTPALLTFWPFYLLTGQHLTNNAVIFIFAALFSAGVYYGLAQFCRRRLPRTPLLLYLLAVNLVIFSSSIMFLLRWHNLYPVPIIAGMALMVWGLAFWEAAGMGGRWVWLKLILGASCLALVAGCRPQTLLLALLVGWFYFGRELLALKWWRGHWRWGLAILVPILIFACGFAYYNYVRFGSPFEFGAGYNLTRTDYSHYGLSLARVPPALFAFLFQPPLITPVFPFFLSNASSDYLGDLYREGTFGGFFWVYPWVIVVWCLPGLRQVLKQKKLWSVVVGLVVVAVIIAVLDVQLMGIAVRYGADFGYWLGLAGALALLVGAQSWLSLSLARRRVLLVSAVCSLGFGLMLTFVTDQTKFFYFTADPSGYYTAYRLFEFWL